MVNNVEMTPYTSTQAIATAINQVTCGAIVSQFCGTLRYLHVKRKLIMAKEAIFNILKGLLETIQKRSDIADQPAFHIRSLETWGPRRLPKKQPAR